MLPATKDVGWDSPTEALHLAPERRWIVEGPIAGMHSLLHAEACQSCHSSSYLGISRVVAHVLSRTTFGRHPVDRRIQIAPRRRYRDLFDPSQERRAHRGERPSDVAQRREGAPLLGREVQCCAKAKGDPYCIDVMRDLRMQSTGDRLPRRHERAQRAFEQHAVFIDHGSFQEAGLLGNASHCGKSPVTIQRSVQRLLVAGQGE